MHGITQVDLTLGCQYVFLGTPHEPLKLAAVQICHVMSTTADVELVKHQLTPNLQKQPRPNGATQH